MPTWGWIAIAIVGVVLFSRVKLTTIYDRTPEGARARDLLHRKRRHLDINTGRVLPGFAGGALDA